MVVLVSVVGKTPVQISNVRAYINVLDRHTLIDRWRVSGCGIGNIQQGDTRDVGDGEGIDIFRPKAQGGIIQDRKLLTVQVWRPVQVEL